MQGHVIKSRIIALVAAAFLILMASLPVMADTSVQPVPYRVGKWLPSDQQTLNKWKSDLIRETDANGDVALLPVIQEFKDMIESDPELFMLFTEMFQQVPLKPPYDKDPTGKSQIRDYKQMLRLLNTIMTRAPEFNKTGLVGFPINAILDWPMGTSAGTTAFLNEKGQPSAQKNINPVGRIS